MPNKGEFTRRTLSEKEKFVLQKALSEFYNSALVMAHSEQVLIARNLINLFTDDDTLIVERLKL